MTAESKCPSQEELADFAGGRLDDEAARQIGAHVTSCEVCALAVQRLHGETADDLAKTRPWSPLPKKPGALAIDTEPEVHDSNFDFTVLEPTPCPEAVGRLGKYDVLGVLGQGGMGVVLRAFDSQLGRAVAIKVLSSYLASSVTARRRFQREGRAAAQISHPNVVTIYSVEEHHGLPFLVMELVKGRSMYERLRTAGPLEPSEVIRLGAQIAAGLAAAHAQNVIHRDIKPGNVMLQDNGCVKITDFGLARIVFDDGELSSHHLIVGTPSYMSPEQVDGREIDTRADLFSLGCLMYAMLAGQSPFQGRHALMCEPPSLHDVDSTVPQFLVDLVARLLEKDPDDRFQSAGEVADLLNEHLIVPKPTPSGAGTGTVPARGRVATSARRRVLMILSAGIALLVLIGVFAGWHPWSGAKQDGPSDLPGNGGGRPAPAEITVAANGQADCRTITEALAAAGPKTVIRVVDGSTYPETLAIGDSQRLRGVQVIGAGSPRPTLAAPKPNARVIDIHNVSGVRIRGFKIDGPAASTAIEIRGSLADVAIEDVQCHCDAGPDDPVVPPTIVVGASGTSAGTGPIAIRGCVIDHRALGQCVLVIGSARAAPAVRLENNRFHSKGVLVLLGGSHQAPLHAVTVAGNLFLDGKNGVNLNLINPPENQNIRIVNNTFLRTENWLGLVQSNTEASGVTVANNLILGAHGIEKAFLEQSLQNWTFKTNWWEINPAKTDRAAYGGLAEMKDQIDLLQREDPEHQDFLRPPSGSSLFSAGAGGDLPAHIGARGPSETRSPPVK